MKSSPAHGLGDHVLHERDAPQQTVSDPETPSKQASGDSGSACDHVPPMIEPAPEPARRAHAKATARPTRYGAHRWTVEQLFERTTPNQASHQLARDLILARTRIFELESALPRATGAPARCGTCRFFGRDEGMPDESWVAGVCRRRAPVEVMTSYLETRWPAVRQKDWCGEHEPHESQPSECGRCGRVVRWPGIHTCQGARP